MAKKTTKTTKSGSQIYMSDKAKKEHREKVSPKSGVDEALTKAMHEGKISPERSGRSQAGHWIEMKDEAFGRTERRRKKKGYKAGGLVGDGRAVKGKTKGRMC